MNADRAVLDCLLENARYDAEAIARMTDLSAAEVDAAIERLEEDGVVQGYRPVVDRTHMDRERVTALVEVDVDLDRETSYGDVADLLSQNRAVRTLRLVSGDFDFLLSMEAGSVREIGRFVAEDIAPIPAVAGTATHYVMETFKEAGIEFDREDDDDRPPLSP
ncbi:MAG: Lrp/AsnC family transcriptional regulator [Halobacteriales archaeon]